jgi:RHH-type proline utilization regulon transcriptional repressor/proline dehydrogenase/delta 1-pyrroline-5-carboxylate dehydrogenase
MRELVPDLLKLAQMAKAHQLNFTVDAEEADRLELSLDVIGAVFSDPSLAGWDGFGLAIQAYQKRAPQVIDYIDDLCKRNGRRMMVRLVKGAYWDTEVKRAQERGLDDYPVWTRKPATDLSYLVCAAQMLSKRERIFPQFATHNALTVSMILELAGADRTGFEFQRLHGMGEALYNNLLSGNERIACRIYAPVGGYRDLLAYLVRRLLENGANSSFVAVAGDKNVPIANLLERPVERLGIDQGKSVRHNQIPMPLALYGERKNSAGFEFGHRESLEELIASLAGQTAKVDAAPLVPGRRAGGGRSCPVAGRPQPGRRNRAYAAVADVDRALPRAARDLPVVEDAGRGARPARQDRRPVGSQSRPAAGAAVRRSWQDADDGIAEIREAVDFCRYYAAQARKLFGEAEAMPARPARATGFGAGAGVCLHLAVEFSLAIFSAGFGRARRRQCRRRQARAADAAHRL